MGVVRVLVILLASAAVMATNKKPVRELLPHRDLRKFGEPSQLLGSPYDLVLMLVSEHLWIRDNYKCMKSKFVNNETDQSFIRRSKFWVPPHRTSNGTSDKHPGNLTYKYDVIRRTGDYTKVNITLISSTANYSFGEHTVQYADDVCMVLEFPKTASYIFRKPRCTMWVLNTTVETQNKYRHCKFILLATCKTPIYNLYEYERDDCQKWGEPPEPSEFDANKSNHC
uniref:Lipocalin n=1 Tax=Rhipicephalus zambeziensis TaxID=60191 RepID=A0A224Y800_9ACAR